MELVILQDVQNAFGSNWARIANTSGVQNIHIGDRFREQGFGPGAEELEVAGVDISPVGGLSRLFFNRGANATKPEVHRLGAVFEQVGIKLEPVAVTAVTSAAISVTNQPTNGSASADAQVAPATTTTSDEGTTEPLVPLKKRRGRPPGSRNKTKAEEVSLPVGFA